MNARAEKAAREISILIAASYGPVNDAGRKTIAAIVAQNFPDEDPDIMRSPRQWHRCNQCGEQWSQPHCPRCTEKKHGGVQ